MSLTSLPTLDELAADPARVTALPLTAVEALLVRCRVAEGVLLARLLAARAQGDGQPETPAGDRLLTVEEAAGKLGVSKDWLYHRAGKLPFTVRLERSLRFSERGIERYIRQRQGR